MDTEDVKGIEHLLDKVKSSSGILIEKIIISEKEEENLKSQVLWGLAVFKRIKIKQTRRTKSLYPQLVVFIGDDPETFYPQSRAEIGINIQEFLDGLLNGEVRCLHDKYKIEDELREGIKSER